jgi:hypothetical protein
MKVNPDDNLVPLDEFKKYVEKITHIEGKVDRIEGHFKKNSDAIADFTIIQNKQSKILDELHNFVIGNEYNDGEGMALQFKSMKTEMKEMSNKQIKYDVYFALMGAGFFIMSSAVVTLVIKVFVGK